MKGFTIVQLVTAAQKALESVKEKLSELVQKHLRKMDQLVQEHQMISTSIRENDGDAFQYRQQEQALYDTYYPVIRACFGIVSAMGKDFKRLYFGSVTPSQFMKNSRKLKKWINGVIAVMAQPENNHLDHYQTELMALQEAVNELLGTRQLTRAERKNMIDAKRKIEATLKKQYHMLKLYVEGWSIEENLNHRYYFEDLRLTAAPKKVEVEVKPDLVPQLEPAPE